MASLTKLYFGWTSYFESVWNPPSDFSIPPGPLLQAWESEGLILNSFQCNREKACCVVELSSSVSPQFAVQRLKGRLQHSFRSRSGGFPGFVRAFHFRSLGQNNRDVAARYIQSQIDTSDLVDPLYRERMKALRYHSDPSGSVINSHKGIHDHYAHVILIVAGRYRMFSAEAGSVFAALKEGVPEMGAELFELSMMPDHVHLLVRWPSDLNAEEVIEGIKQSSGKQMRRTAFWNDGGYVGTVGPYSLAVAMENNRRNGWAR